MSPLVTVLVVDDDADIRRLFRRILRAPEFAVLEAETLAKARLAAETARFDLLLCDVHLPDGCGLDFLEELRRAAPETKAVVLTGQPTEDIRKRARGLGAAFVAKPFVISDLLVAVESVEVKGEQR